MYSLGNKIILITGASSGIGKACATACAKASARLILAARRIEALHVLDATLKEEYGAEALCLALDVQDKHAVTDILGALPANWRDIDILVNNAGLALSRDKIQEGRPGDWDTMISTNLNGLLYVTHAILPKMVARNQGHIVNISSVAGHEYYPGGNIYSATKHAVRALSKSMRLDLLGTALRVTDIAPGMVHTEFSKVRFQDDARAEAVYQNIVPLEAEDVADAVLYCITRPAHVDVSEMVIYPTMQASTNHIYRTS